MLNALSTDPTRDQTASVGGLRPWWLVFILIGMVPLGSIAEAEQRRTPLVEAIERVQPAVVNISSQKRMLSSSRWPYSPEETGHNRVSGMGTGVILDRRGFILTNFHVIDRVDDIRVRLLDGSTWPAVVVQQDSRYDLALIRIESNRVLPEIAVGTSSDLMVGEDVITIGNAFGYENTVARGVISWLNRNVTLADNQVYRNLIQTDAAINPGNSGGPLVNIHGELIGINVAVRAGAQGIGFALPIDDVMQIVQQMMSTRQISSTYHGVVAQSIRDDVDESLRLRVSRIVPGSPAERSGLREGDRILSIGSIEQVHHPLDVERGLIGVKPGQQISVVVDRGGSVEQLDLTVDRLNPDGSVPEPRMVSVSTASATGGSNPIRNQLGLEAVAVGVEYVSQVSQKLRGGLYVLSIVPETPASDAQLKQGDILIGMSVNANHWETVALENVLYILNQWKANPSGPIAFYLVRNNQVLYRSYQPTPSMARSSTSDR